MYLCFVIIELCILKYDESRWKGHYENIELNQSK